jgi:hypothetical protein
MSRGCGQVQRALLAFVMNAKRPVAYAEIIAELLQASGVNDPTVKLQPSRERAIRRALKGLCDRDLLSALGTGRPGDPYRYTMSQICVLCRTETDDEKVLHFANRLGSRGTLCFQCAGVVAQAYFEQVLPERLAARDQDQSGPEPDQLSAPSDVSPVADPLKVPA